MKTKKDRIQRMLLLALGLVAFVVLLLYAVIFLLPKQEAIKSPDGSQTFWAIAPSLHYSLEQQLIALVIGVGMLGSTLRAITSFVRVSTKGQFEMQRIWSYIIRPVTGGFTAAIAYFLLRGSLFIGANSPEKFNAYGLMCIAMLSGFFSTDLLKRFKRILSRLFEQGT